MLQYAEEYLDIVKKAIMNNRGDESIKLLIKPI